MRTQQGGEDVNTAGGGLSRHSNHQGDEVNHKPNKADCFLALRMLAWLLPPLALLTGVAAAGCYVIWRRRRDAESGTETRWGSTHVHTRVTEPEHRLCLQVMHSRTLDW